MNYYLIPIELCEFCLVNKISKPFQLYMLLKLRCSGKKRISKSEINEMATELGYRSERSIRNNLKELQKYNFVGHNPKSGYFFIRSFDKIRVMHGLMNGRMGVFFYKEDLKSFKAFLIGAVIAKTVYINKMREKALGLRRESPKHSAPSSYFPISHSFLANNLDIASSTAADYKNIAAKAGYITIKKVLTPLDIDWRIVHLYKRAVPEEAHKIRVLNKNVFLQESDLVGSNMEFKRRKNFGANR